MFEICRVDTNPHGEATYFFIQGAYRKRDLKVADAWASGFVGPNDKLVLFGPDGRLRQQLTR